MGKAKDRAGHCPLCAEPIDLSAPRCPCCGERLEGYKRLAKQRSVGTWPATHGEGELGLRGVLAVVFGLVGFAAAIHAGAVIQPLVVLASACFGFLVGAALPPHRPAPPKTAEASPAASQETGQGV